MSQKFIPKFDKKNSLFLALVVVLAIAVVVALVMVGQRGTLASQVDTLNNELTASQQQMETIAAEKEALQAELTTAQDVELKNTVLRRSQAHESTKQKRFGEDRL